MDLSFMVIDDSELDCFIARKVIAQINDNARIDVFLSSAEALSYISRGIAQSVNFTVVILDLMMPLMNGLQFIESFEKLPLAQREKYFIVVLTASMIQSDLNKVRSYQSVRDLLDKPFTARKMYALMEKAAYSKNALLRSGK